MLHVWRQGFDTALPRLAVRTAWARKSSWWGRGKLPLTGLTTSYLSDD